MLTKCQEESHVCNIINLKVARQKLFQGHAKSIVASHECFQLTPVVRQLQGSLVIILRIFFLKENFVRKRISYLIFLPMFR